jgi:predicted PurR-regulated permease PerM
MRELPRILLAVLFMVLAIIASLWILQPFLPALIWSTLIVVSTWPLMRAVQKRLRGKRGLAVIVMTTALLLIVIVPLALAVLTIIEHADDVSALEFGDEASADGCVSASDLGPVPVAPFELRRCAARAYRPYARDAARWVRYGGSLAVFFLHLVLTVIISAMLYYSGERAVVGVRAFGRRLAGPRGEDRDARRAGDPRSGVGVIVTAVVQAVLGGIGLVVAGVPLAGFLTALMFVSMAQIEQGQCSLAVAWLY